MSEPDQALRRDVEAVIQGSELRSVYQPIVELDGAKTVGYEALARGPVGTELERPDRLFAAARSVGMVGELDWACKTAAVRGALEGHLAPPLTLFVNSEPEAAGSLMPAPFAASWALAKLSYLHLVFEVTERAVATRPAELLRTIGHLRSLGWGIALDDVGMDPESLALLPFVRPDVIKLDMRAVQEPDRALVDVLMAVNAEAERSGAVILAEGIETEAHLARARTLGATLGQGWLFGRPGPLPPDPAPAGRALVVRPPTERSASTPFELLSARLRPRRATRSELEALSHAFEDRAGALPLPPLLVAGFQKASRFVPQRGRYTDLAARLPFVAAFGEDMPARPAPRVRGVETPPGDPLASQWFIGAVSSFNGFAMAAVEDETSADEFLFVVTFDRELATEGTEVMLDRITAAPTEGSSDLVDFSRAMDEMLDSERHLSESVRPLLEVMSRATGLESVFLSRIGDGEYEIAHAVNNGALVVAEGTTLPWTQAICKRALDVGRSSFSDVQADLPDVEVAGELGFRRFVTFPIVLSDGTLAGTLCGASTSTATFGDEELAAVQAFATLVSARLGLTSTFTSTTTT